MEIGNHLNSNQINEEKCQKIKISKATKRLVKALQSFLNTHLNSWRSIFTFIVLETKLRCKYQILFIS